MAGKFRRINITLPDSVLQELREIREREGIPISTQLRKGFEQRMKRNFTREVNG